jgi:hypothetical protein
MGNGDFITELLARIEHAKTSATLKELLEDANTRLHELKFTEFERRAFWDSVIKRMTFHPFTSLNADHARTIVGHFFGRHPHP